MPTEPPVADPVDVVCPRCATPASVRFYGPCDACRQQLRDSLGGVARQVEAAAYQPKANVVPNQVATKE